jgi:uncharacterized membrane protein
LKLARSRALPLWAIPMIYVAFSVAAGIAVPRLEQLLPSDAHAMSPAAAMAAFSAVASGSMAFTGIVFAVAFVVVQFSAVAYSPRLVVMFAGAPRLYHTLGLFFATFTFSLAALAWTDRHGSSQTPLVSTYLVFALLIASMLAFAILIAAVQELQIQNVLQTIGSHGRAVITAMFEPAGAEGTPAGPPELPGAAQVFVYAGAPLAVASLNIPKLVEAARAAGVVLVAEFAVGDTLIAGAPLFRVHGGQDPRLRQALERSVYLSSSRTFEQDPKYALRILVDVAIRALSPAVNDPTTAVQALDQIEDLLVRLGLSRLDAGVARDPGGAVRLVFPAPTWDDYLGLGFDEIRQYGADSLQVNRRMRAALGGLADHLPKGERREAVLSYGRHLDENLRRSTLDETDRAAGMREDRQGLGLSRERPA